MKAALSTCLFVCLSWNVSGQCLTAETPKNLDVTINGRGLDLAEPLTPDQWHAITARYRCSTDLSSLTHTYLVICTGANQLTGFYVGYQVPTNQLQIVKHGFWNDTEATGSPEEAGKILENDQGYVDCEHSRITKTADGIAVTYQVKFKPGVLKGGYNVFLYIEDKNGAHDGFSNVGSIVIEGDGVITRAAMPAAWQNALKPIGNPSPSILLADRGKSQCVLAIPKSAKDVEIKAAGDLARYFKLISGADFPIVAEDALPPGDGAVVSIGRTKLLEQSESQWKDADLGDEGYVVDVLGDKLYLYGGRGRGLMHGVYSLLEEDLGCRWYSTSSIDVPKLDHFAAAITPRKYIPVLELRDPYIYKAWDPVWSLRNKTNAPNAPIPTAWGGSQRYYVKGHTYSMYFPPEKYFAEHPEYYALVNGKRQTSQLCNTNEDVIRLSIEKTCQIFRDHPEISITAIGPNDGRGFCDCPECKKLCEENGGRAGAIFHHVNRIAEGVKKEFPNNHLISLAYLDYAQPPTKLKVDPYVIVQLCTDSHAWKYQFCFCTESEDFQRMIKGWHAAGAKIYIWDYTTDYVHFFVPMPNWAVVAENTRYFIDNGATGVMLESEINDSDEMRGWVWAKQLWNPTLDAKALLKDFVFGYYRESGQPLWDLQMAMWDYWEKWHSVPHQCGVTKDHPLLNNLQCSCSPDELMFTPAFLTKMRAHFEEAERLAPNADILARVEKAKISLLYLELSQQLGYYTEFGDFIDGTSMREPPAKKQALKARVEEFVALCKQNEISKSSIFHTPDEMAAKWQACIDLDGSAVPRKNLPALWIFTTDPDDRGVNEKWYANQKFFDAAVKNSDQFGGGQTSIATLEKGLAWVHINRGVGWEQQGFPGFDRYGWYFQNIDVPDDLLAKQHAYFYIPGVNEEAWVYVNGEFAFERTYASTGKSVGELEHVAFSSDIKKYLKPGANRIAIRVAHKAALGGIWLPITLFGTAEECSTEQLDAYRR